jgi:uncharacterized protein (TIGR03083 family)
LKPLSVADVRTAVAREWRQFIGFLPAPSDSEGWQATTRCQGWSVADLAAHAVWGASLEADALHRARRGVTAPAEGRTIDAAAVSPEVIVAELRAAHRALLAELAAVDDRDGDRIVPLPYGQLPLTLFLPILVMEAGIHTDDLAAAVHPAGGAPLPDDVVLASTAFLATFLPVLAAAAEDTPAAGTVVALRGPTVDLRLSFGDGGWSTETIDDATGVIEADDDSTVVRFALGRLRADDPRLAVSGFPGLGHAFKRWFPGP